MEPSSADTDPMSSWLPIIDREIALDEIKERRRAEAKLERMIPNLELKAFHCEVKLRYARELQRAKLQEKLQVTLEEIRIAKESLQTHRLTIYRLWKMIDTLK